MVMVGYEYGHQGEEAVIYVAYFKIICVMGVERRDKGSALFHITEIYIYERQHTISFVAGLVVSHFAVTAKLIRAFVFAKRIVLLYFLNPICHLLCLYTSVCVGLVRKPYSIICFFMTRLICSLRK